MDGDFLVLVSIVNIELILIGSFIDGSEKEVSYFESSVDVDSEVLEFESVIKQIVLLRFIGGYTVYVMGYFYYVFISELFIREIDRGYEGVAEVMVEFRLSSIVIGDRDFEKENQLLNVLNNLCFLEGKYMVFYSF